MFPLERTLKQSRPCFRTRVNKGNEKQRHTRTKLQHFEPDTGKEPLFLSFLNRNEARNHVQIRNIDPPFGPGDAQAFLRLLGWVLYYLFGMQR